MAISLLETTNTCTNQADSPNHQWLTGEPGAALGGKPMICCGSTEWSRDCSRPLKQQKIQIKQEPQRKDALGHDVLDELLNAPVQSHSNLPGSQIALAELNPTRHRPKYTAPSSGRIVPSRETALANRPVAPPSPLGSVGTHRSAVQMARRTKLHRGAGIAVGHRKEVLSEVEAVLA